MEESEILIVEVPLLFRNFGLDYHRLRTDISILQDREEAAQVLALVFEDTPGRAVRDA